MNPTVLAALIAATAAISVGILANWEKITRWVKPKHIPIRKRQLMLRSAGFDIAADGLVGAETTRAILAFQKSRKLEVSGTFDARTMSQLKSVCREFRATQKNLNKMGYSLGSDGLCGPMSSEALRDFQLRSGLAVTGVPDAETRAKCSIEASKL